MKNMLKFNGLSDCIMGIRERLEMIEHLSDNDTINEGVKLMGKDCDRMSELFTQLYNTVPGPKPKPVDNSILEEAHARQAKYHEEAIDKQAEHMKDVIDKDILDGIETAGGLGFIPESHVNQALIDNAPEYAEKLEATFEDTKNPVDLES